MRIFERRVRHPFFPGWRATAATTARGECEVLAGSLEEVLAAAQRGVRPRRAVWILDAIEEQDRTALWDLFEVPALAIQLNGEGALVAFECEAHEGLHVAGGFAADGTGELCPCGRPGPRLRA